MAKIAAHVEVDAREVRIIRSDTEAQQLGCSPVIIVPASEVVRAMAVPGPSGSRYLRLEATRAAVHPDPERDPLVVRFERRDAGEADRLAQIIQRNALAAGHGPTQPAQAPVMNEQLQRNVNRALTVGMWSSGVLLALILIPVVFVAVIVVLIVVS